MENIQQLVLQLENVAAVAKKVKINCNIFDNHCDLYINIDFFPLPFQYFDVDMDFIKNLNLLNLSPIFYSYFFYHLLYTF